MLFFVCLKGSLLICLVYDFKKQTSYIHTLVPFSNLTHISLVSTGSRSSLWLSFISHIFLVSSSSVSTFSDDQLDKSYVGAVNSSRHEFTLKCTKESRKGRWKSSRSYLSTTFPVPFLFLAFALEKPSRGGELWNAQFSFWIVSILHADKTLSHKAVLCGHSSCVYNL